MADIDPTKFEDLNKAINDLNKLIGNQSSGFTANLRNSSTAVKTNTEAVKDNTKAVKTNTANTEKSSSSFKSLTQSSDALTRSFDILNKTISGGIDLKSVEKNLTASTANINQSLNATLSGMNASQAAANKVQQKANTEYSQSIQSSTKATLDGVKAQEKSGKFTKEELEKRKQRAAIYERAMNSAIDVVANFTRGAFSATSGMKKYGDALEGITTIISGLMFVFGGPIVKVLAAVVTVLGKLFVAASEHMQKLNEVFEQVAEYGQITSRGIMSVQENIHSFGLTLKDHAGVYQQIIQSTSESLGAFGSTAGDGAKNLANMFKSDLVNTELETMFRNIGYNTESLAKTYTRVAKQMIDFGAGYGKTNQQVGNITTNYMKNLQELSELTGQNRDKLLEEREAMMREQSIQLKYQEMVAAGQQTQADAMMAGLAAARQFGPMAYKAAQEIVSVGDVISGDALQYIAMRGKESMDAIQGMVSGKNVDEIHRAQKRYADETIKYSQRYGSQMAGILGGVDTAALGLATEDIRRANIVSRQSQEAGMKAIEDTTKAMKEGSGAQRDAAVADARATRNNAQALEKTIGSAANGLAPVFERLAKISEYLGKVMNYATEAVVTFFKRFGIDLDDKKSPNPEDIGTMRKTQSDLKNKQDIENISIKNLEQQKQIEIDNQKKLEVERQKLQTKAAESKTDEERKKIADQMNIIDKQLLEKRQNILSYEAKQQKHSEKLNAIQNDINANNIDLKKHENLLLEQTMEQAKKSKLSAEDIKELGLKDGATVHDVIAKLHGSEILSRKGSNKVREREQGNIQKYKAFLEKQGYSVETEPSGPATRSMSGGSPTSSKVFNTGIKRLYEEKSRDSNDENLDARIERLLKFGGGTGNKDSFKKLEPQLIERVLTAAEEFNRLSDGKDKLQINSAFRTAQEQERLNKELKSKDPNAVVAEPGKSKHEHGLAVDIQQAAKLAEMGILERAGLKQLSKNLSDRDPWHIEMLAKGGITSGVSVAGENGPEAVIPLADGRTVPVSIDGMLSVDTSPIVSAITRMTEILDERLRIVENHMNSVANNTGEIVQNGYA